MRRVPDWWIANEPINLRGVLEVPFLLPLAAPHPSSYVTLSLISPYTSSRSVYLRCTAELRLASRICFSWLLVYTSEYVLLCLAACLLAAERPVLRSAYDPYF